MDILVFSVCRQNLGFELSYVERVIHAVSVTRLPNSPPHILGIINLQGEIIPVLNFRRILGFEEREIKLSDQFIICKTSNSRVAFWVDATDKVFEPREAELISSNDVLQHLDELQKTPSNINCIQQVIKNGKVIILLYNIKKILDFYHVKTEIGTNC